MAKFYGSIGYGMPSLIRPGVWKESIIEHNYYGDVVSNIRDLQTSTEVNDNINVANKISILSDPFANENFHLMRFVVLQGVKWKIKKVEVQYPRLILTIGDLYNGK